MSMQKGWKWCKRCDELYYTQAASGCPRGGAHDASSSSAYLPFFAPRPGAQDGWRWCKRCGAMYYGNLGGGRCIHGGPHDPSGSGNYAMQSGSPGGYAQTGWRWCKNCHVLFYGPSGGGCCPAANGGRHDSTGSSDYGLRFQIAGEGLAVTCEGAGNSGEIWLLLNFRGSWLPPQRVPGGCTNTPSPVMFEDKLHIYYQGQGNSHDLWFTTFDGIDFSPSQQVPDVRLEGAPSTVVRNDRLEIYLAGTSEYGHLWHISRQKGTSNWAKYDYSRKFWVWNDPSATLVGNETWVAYEERWKENGELYWHGTGKIKIADHYTGMYTIPGTGSSGTPGIVAFGGRVYVFHEDHASHGELWYNVCDPNAPYETRWAGDRRIAGVGTSGTPAPVVFNDKLHVFHEGLGDNGELRLVTSDDGTTWSADQKINGIGCSNSCGVTKFNLKE
jgi:hypothetical protein